MPFATICPADAVAVHEDDESSASPEVAQRAGASARRSVGFVISRKIFLRRPPPSVGGGGSSSGGPAGRSACGGLLVVGSQLEDLAVHPRRPGAEAVLRVQAPEEARRRPTARALADRGQERLLGALHPLGVLEVAAGEERCGAQPRLPLHALHHRLEQLDGVPVLLAAEASSLGLLGGRVQRSARRTASSARRGLRLADRARRRRLRPRACLRCGRLPAAVVRAAPRSPRRLSVSRRTS